MVSLNKVKHSFTPTISIPEQACDIGAVVILQAAHPKLTASWRPLQLSVLVPTLSLSYLSSIPIVPHLSPRVV